MSNDYARRGHDHYSGAADPRGAPRDARDRSSSRRRSCDGGGRVAANYHGRETSRFDDRRKDRSRSHERVRSPPARKTSSTAPRNVAKPESASAKSAPAPTPSKSQSAPSANGYLDADVKRVTELLCDRVYWYMQRDSADKNHKKLQSEADRIKANQPDFGSAYEWTKLQIEAAAAEKAKLCLRLDAADSKLTTAIRLAVGNLPRPKADETPKPGSDSALTERTALEIESRTCAAQRSIEVSLTKKLAEESFSVKKSLRTEFESESTGLKSQITKLETQLHTERARGDLLEKKVNELACKMDTLNKASQAPSQKALVSREELENALQEFDEKISSTEGGAAQGQLQPRGPAAGDKTAHRLRSLLESTRSLESSLQNEYADNISQSMLELRKDMEIYDGTIKKQADQQIEANSAIEAIKLSMDKISAELVAKEAGKMPGDTQKPEAISADMSDDRIQQVSRAEVDKRLRTEFLPTIVAKLTGYIEGEREKREGIAKKTENMATEVSVLRIDLNGLKDRYGVSLVGLGNQVAQQRAELASQGQRVTAVETNLPAVRVEAKSGIDELAMQVRHVQSWQNNFTTRPLYRDIVEHINATLPSGVLNQLRNLAMRIEGVEGRLETTEGSAAKRRKLHNDGPVTVANGDK